MNTCIYVKSPHMFLPSKMLFLRNHSCMPNFCDIVNDFPAFVNPFINCYNMLLVTL